MNEIRICKSGAIEYGHDGVEQEVYADFLDVFLEAVDDWVDEIAISIARARELEDLRIVKLKDDTREMKEAYKALVGYVDTTSSADYGEEFSALDEDIIRELRPIIDSAEQKINSKDLQISYGNDFFEALAGRIYVKAQILDQLQERINMVDMDRDAE